MQGFDLPFGQRRFPVGPDGTFSISGLPPGDLDVVLWWMRSDRPGSWKDARRTIASLRVDEGETRALDIDVQDLMPSVLRGQILIDRVAARENDILISWRLGGGDGPGFREEYGPVRTDKSGNYELTVAGGEICPVLIFGDGRMLSGTWQQIEPGRNLEMNFAFEQRRAAITVLAADGRTPASHRRFQLFGECALGSVTTDSEGKAVIFPAPPGRFRLRTMDDPHDIVELEWMEVPSDRRESVFTLRFPTR